MAVLVGEYTQIEQFALQPYDWSDLDNAVDSTSNTYAYATLPDDQISYIRSEDALATVHTIDTTRSDYILQVEVGIRGYSTIDGDVEWRRVILGGFDPAYGSAGSFQFFDSTSTTYWHDITQDNDFPDYGFWTWEDIENLQLYFRSDRFNSDPESGDYTVYIDQVFVRVTTQDTPIDFYGLECWDSTGNQTLRVTDRITRVIFSKEVASLNEGNENFSMPLDGITSAFGFAYALDGLEGGMAHNVSVTYVNETTLNCAWTENSVFLSGPDVYIVPSAPSLLVVLGW